MSDQIEATPSGEAGIRRSTLPAAQAGAARPRAAGRQGAAPAAVARGLVRAARPRQWTKNLLVLAAPGAAGVLGQGTATGRVALAFAAFCLVASGTYLLNDTRDADADRRHPTKRHRPIAAGLVPPRLAVASGLALLAAGLGIAAAVSLPFLAVVAGYLALTTAYTLRLRDVAVLDIAAVAGFFIVRAVAGGVAVDVPLSRWFLIVASFGSLFIVAAKRAGEHTELGEERSGTRATLGVYPLEYLRNIRTMAAGVTVTAYCLWAFEQSRPDASAAPFYELSIIPFVLFVLRYALLAETRPGSPPEELVLADRGLLAAAIAWIAVFGFGVHYGG